MTRYELVAFSDELEKIAFPGGAFIRKGIQTLAERGSIRGALAGGGAKWITEQGAIRGALVGGGVGGVGNAARAASQGEDTKGVLRAGLRGAAGGVAIGAIGSGLGRRVRDVRLLKPGMGAGETATATATSLGQGVKNFLKRQRHGFTGKYRDQAGNIGLGGVDTANKRIALNRLRRSDQLGRATSNQERNKIWEATAKKNKSLLERGTQQQGALDAGITSMRGIGQGLLTSPKATTKAMWRYGSGKGLSGKAMSLGVPAAIMAPELARGDESATGGKSLTNKILNTGAYMGAGVALGGVPIVANLAGWDLASRLSDVPFRRKAPPQRPSGPVQPRVQYT